MTSITASKIIGPERSSTCTPFYSNIMAGDHFFHILRLLHFENNDNPPIHDNPDYDRLRKIQKISDILNNKFCELYNPTEQLAVDEVIVLYKGRVVFRQYIPKKHKRFGIKIYKLCDCLGYTLWYECVFRQTKATCHSSNNSNAWNGAVTYSKSWGIGPQNIHGQLFHFACSVWWSVPMKNQCAWNSSPWQAWITTRYWAKISENEKGGIVTQVRGTLRAICWKDRWDVYILTNMPLLKEISPKNLARLSNFVL